MFRKAKKVSGSVATPGSGQNNVYFHEPGFKDE
jgi:hypothetical protein